MNALGGYRVQGRGEEGERLLHDAKILQAAGAFSVVLECVPAPLATRVTEALCVPTIGIGAGPACDAQVLVWQDMAGLSPQVAKFVEEVRGPGRGARRGGDGLRRGCHVGAFPDEGAFLQVTRSPV